MDKLVIQVGTRHGRIAELVRSQNGIVKIGRAFDNDLVLTDVHVAPHQIRIELNEGYWRLKVLDETNPVHLNGQQVLHGETIVQAGDQLTLGRTRLFIFPEDHEVEPTRKLMFANWLSAERIHPLVPLLLLITVSLFDFLLTYLDTAVDLDWERMAPDQLWGTVIIVIWAAGWAFIGRLLRHQHHFGLQLIASAATLLFASILLILVEYAVYPFQDPLIEDLSSWVAVLAILFVLLRFNLMIATNMQRPGLMASFFAVFVAMLAYGLYYFDDPQLSSYQAQYSNELKPPILGAYDGVSADTYFAEIALQMEQQLEEEEDE